MQLCCGCLNVCLEVGETDLDPADISEIQPAHLQTHFFTPGQVAAATLRLAGVTIKYKCLTEETTAGRWKVVQCLNCGLFTHACPADSKTGDILVSREMQICPPSVPAAQQSADFSPAFQLILPCTHQADLQEHQPHQPDLQKHQPHQPDLQPAAHKHQPSQPQLGDSCSAAQQELHSRLALYLQHHRARMEEAIRRVTEEQHRQFEKLERRAVCDEACLIRVLRAAEQRKLSACQAATAQQTESRTEPRTESAESTARLTSLETLTPAAAHVPAQPPQASHTEMTSDYVEQLGWAASTNMDADTLFELDDIMPQPRGQVHMDKAAAGTSFLDDTLLEEHPAASEMAVLGPRLYATSLPVDMPFMSQARTAQEEDTGFRGSVQDPEQMVASMKALAMSVQEDGTQMFGDLPRPRVNTGDLLARW